MAGSTGSLAVIDVDLWRYPHGAVPVADNWKMTRPLHNAW